MPLLEGSLNWLVSDASRLEARIKFDIKQLECHLKMAVERQGEALKPDSRAKQIVLSLIKSYRDYLFILGVDENNPIPAQHFGTNKTNNTLQQCYEHILDLQSSLPRLQSQQEKIIQLGLLLGQYQSLADLIAKSTVKDFPKEEKQINAHLKNLLAANMPESWLNAMAGLAGACTSSRLDLKLWLDMLPAEQLLKLSHGFHKQEFLDAIHAVFFYKLHPQYLFLKRLHPEKLISIKARLTGFYQFIESLQAALMHILEEKNIAKLRDLLFHGDELPVGIEIEVNTAYRHSIQILLKSLPFCFSSGKNEEIFMYIEEVFRAYKFWFNPSRLIDAIMVLKQKIASEHPDKASEFYQQMRELYGQLATTDCLDLYGYFANKASCYLMRTLLSIQQNDNHPWLPELTEQEKQAINNMYEDLNCVMEALREELVSRNIVTKPYDRHLSGKKISPGQRIRATVIRILSLYSKKMANNNSKLEHLFALLEDHG